MKGGVFMKAANISENNKTKKINEKIMDVLIKIFVKEYKNGEEIETKEKAIVNKIMIAMFLALLITCIGICFFMPLTEKTFLCISFVISLRKAIIEAGIMLILLVCFF